MAVEDEETRTIRVGGTSQFERVSASLRLTNAAGSPKRDHSYKSAKKNELELIVEEHLNKNSGTLAKDAKVTPFYTVAEIKSPAEKKPRQRRQTLRAQETEPLYVAICAKARDTDNCPTDPPTRQPRQQSGHLHVPWRSPNGFPSILRRRLLSLSVSPRKQTPSAPQPPAIYQV